MASSAALPLKVTSTPSKPERTTTPAATASTVGKQTSGVSDPSDISSPHELTAYVENLLEQLDAKFDDMSSQILDRMMQMSGRVDALEASIQDIINGDTNPANSLPSSPAATATNTPGPPRRSGSTAS
ncbi:uncharacterized protein STEHIDRAFT_95469 [Stereum hirsutum FP-91666 SS1]|uniref:uncharacterized protein n=1 Tax=Stereum hirsutum (strain FP-91666) TaxID=721885 RepID=UPI000440BE97|nr:uncharacterized protein STEHIDRAFT_95469 [Stereum hirsutum FP-91666 SS1]EIM88336.1 hypothetical protein STEHIDRAFT_95469 [Stereum hirsutum FP-91666 SS1]